MENLLHIVSDAITLSEIEELKQIVNAKYDKRIELYDRGIKQWDTNVFVTMIIRGMK